MIAQGQEGDKRLVAFYRAKETTPEQIVQLSADDLRGHLSKTLPDYMVPAVFVSLAEIPLNSNGKVDRKALARMEVTIVSSKEYVAPRSEMEKQLAGIWSRILNLPVEKIGINDSFFELGGHSLSVVQLMAKINKAFGQLLPLAVMFTAPNIAGLAKLISDKETVPSQILVPIQTNGNAPPIFGVPGAGGNVLSLRLLGKTLGESQPFYGLQAVGMDGATQPLESVEQTAQAYIAALKTIQPCGPYSLLGHSYGGVVAFEMARILLEQAEQISSLILIDSIAPWVMQGMQAGDEAAELFEACMEIASLHGARLDLNLNRLRRSSNGETVQYIVHSLNKIGVEIDAGQFTAFLGVYRANQSCYRRYHPPALPRAIDVSLYRATHPHQERAILPPDYGWNQLLQSPVRLYDVDADHFSILEKNIFKNRVESNQREHEAAKSAD